MTQQMYTGQFTGLPENNPSLPHGLPYPVNLADGGWSNTASQWTTGATATMLLPVQAPLLRGWSLLALTLSFYGAIYIREPPSLPYGRLGKIIGGLSRAYSPSGPASNPWSQTLRLPADQSGLSTIWDGNTDAPFPTWPGAGAPALDLHTTTIMPPVPWTLAQADQVMLGLWLTPSLVKNAAIYIYGATYSVIIDDGRPG